MIEINRVCRVCLNSLPITSFKKNNRLSSGYTKTCKSCANLEMAARGGSQYKHKNKQAVVIEAKSKPCKDCMIQYDYYIMQFDHLPQYQKLFNLSLYRKYKIDEIIREIEKCDVVCANCHARRSFMRK